MSDWTASAACSGMDTELFFEDEETARGVCAGCPVRGECLEWVMGWETGARWGVYGGLSPDERKSLGRRTQRMRRQPEPDRDPERVGLYPDWITSEEAMTILDAPLRRVHQLAHKRRWRRIREGHTVWYSSADVITTAEVDRAAS